MPPRLPRKLTRLQIDDVSSVDNGAGVGVKVMLMKREEPKMLTDIQKAAAKQTQAGLLGEMADAIATQIQKQHPGMPRNVARQKAYSDPRISDIVRHERDAPLIAEYQKRFGDKAMLPRPSRPARIERQDESSHMPSAVPGSRRGNESLGQWRAPSVGRGTNESSSQVLSPGTLARQHGEPDADDLPPGATNAYKQLHRLAQSQCKLYPHLKLSPQQAMARVLATPEGRRLHEMDKVQRGVQVGQGDNFGY